MPADVTAQAQDDVAIVIHGGAGTISPDEMTDELERQYRDALQTALERGHEVLTDGGSSTEAVVAAITSMEEDSLFNAGKGSVFTMEDEVELDASIMEGNTRNAGALAGVQHIKNPIEGARLIMDESRHVMMAGEGAESFARDHDIEFVENEYFYTQHRLEQAREAREQSDARDAASYTEEEASMGTVGAAALDQDGNIASGTSTGGMTNKKWGRIGDSPIIGAGTYADNRAAAVSATGHGEYFIRSAVAHNISARMLHRGESINEAAEAIIMDEIPDLGGYGGIIGLDADGNIAMPFNTEGMYRGYVDTEGEMVVRIYGDTMEE